MNCYTVLLTRQEQKCETVFEDDRQSALVKLQAKYQDTGFRMTALNGASIIGVCAECRKWCVAGDKVHGLHGLAQFICDGCYKPGDPEFDKVHGTTKHGTLYVKAAGQPTETD